MTSKTQTTDGRWKMLTDHYEKRRKLVGVSKRKLALTAELEPSYYQHWLAGDFMFPTEPKLAALDDALDHLDEVKRLEKRRSGKSIDALPARATS
ncbi:MAG: hypothetical protein COB16_19455 [Rhodobacteraceae bacterium]|nr:MAG: hypothetical protein COB16_19455 [Paracoccaceae bacterium]